MRLIVGLGNPGPDHQQHRHNVGFMVIDAIADQFPNGQFVKKFHGVSKQINIGGQRVLLLKPQTFMNKSGTSVAEAARFYKIPPKDVLVIHDELDLAPGKVRVKTGGSAGGHNGLKSIDAHLGNAYERMRIGIGHPGDKAKVNGHVLSNFSNDDQVWLAPLLDQSAQHIERLLRGDVAGFLNKLAMQQSATASGKTATKSQQKAQPAPASKAATRKPEDKSGASSIWQVLKDRWHAKA